MTNSQYMTQRGSAIWAFVPEDGEPLLFDSPVVWFSNEFMHRPLDGFEIDWGPLANNAHEHLKSLGNPRREPGQWVYPDCLKGVIIKLPERQRIWVLTGEYDYERDGHQGRWPD